MIYRISVRDFRGIRSLDKPLEFSKHTIVIGPSGSGKTTLLESLFMVPPINVSIPLISVTKVDAIGKHRLCPSLVYRYHGVAKLWGELKGRGFEFLLKCDSREGWPEVSGMIGNTAVDLTREALQDHEEVDEIIEKLELELGVHPSSLSVYFPNDLRFLLMMEKELAREDKWVYVERSGLSVKVVQELVDKGSLSERYTDATIRRSSIALRKETPRNVTYVYSFDLGEGLMRFLLGRMYLELAKPSIVLWDVIEAGLSPPLIATLIDYLLSGDWQSVITTHSIDVLRHIAYTQKSGVKIVQIHRGIDDTVKWKEFSVSELAELLDKGIDPRRTIIS
ncbi:MAG: hypothetical protein QXS85_01840 [Acidilobaceae archaeon]